MKAKSRNYPLDPTLGDFYVAYDEEQRDEHVRWCKRTGWMPRCRMFSDGCENEGDDPGTGSSNDPL